MPTVCFSKQAIRDYLKNFGKGPNSKDHELLIGLALANFHEDVFLMPSNICFEIQSRYIPEFNGVKQVNLSLSEIEKIINLQKKEDTDIDVSIISNIGQGNMTARHFQLKRIFHATTKKIIDTVNGYSKRYPKTNTTLLIAILADNVEIDFPAIARGIATEIFPFSKLMYFGGSGNEILIGELWPSNGENTYSVQELVDVKGNEAKR